MQTSFNTKYVSSQDIVAAQMKLCAAQDATSLKQVIKRIVMKDKLRQGESLVYFS